jgi:putative transposase
MLWRRVIHFLQQPLDDFKDKEIAYLLAENLLLRQQLVSRPRLTLAQKQTLATLAKALAPERLQALASIVQPATLLKWHRNFVARKFTSTRCPTGRPGLKEETKTLILTLALENLSWGYTRLRGMLRHLGHPLAKSTIAKVLQEAGVAPAPDRTKHERWFSFMKRHRDGLWSCDFLTTEVWTLSGLKTFYVLFFLQVQTRRVVLAGITEHPQGIWVEQTARELTGDGAALNKATALIHDRDSKFTSSFAALFESVGCQVVKLPPFSPNLNAHAERFVKSIKTECLERMIFLGQSSLHHAVKDYLLHYHQERPHQGLDNVIPFPIHASAANGKIQRHSRLGGLLNYYYRSAADAA